MNNNILVLPLCFLMMIQTLFGEYKRRSDLENHPENKEILTVGEAIIYPSFEARNTKVTRVLESLSEGTSRYSKKKDKSGYGIGLSIMCILNPNDSNPSISVKVKNKNFFEILDVICEKAGPDFFWSARDAVLVYQKTDSKSVPRDPFKKPEPNPEVINRAHPR